MHPACASHAPPLLQAHLPGVVETFGLNVISLLIHHRDLGVQVPAQVLGKQGSSGRTEKRAEESSGPQLPFPASSPSAFARPAFWKGTDTPLPSEVPGC